MSDDPRAELAARQADLLAALVAGAPTPPGVDPHRVAVAARALHRKRRREVAHHWPALLATETARVAFDRWAPDHPRRGSFRDGWDFAEDRERHAGLDTAGAAELAAVRAGWRRAADGTPVRRRQRRWWRRWTRTTLWAAPPARRRGAG